MNAAQEKTCTSAPERPATVSATEPASSPEPLVTATPDLTEASRMFAEVMARRLGAFAAAYRGDEPDRCARGAGNDPFAHEAAK